MVFEGVSVWIRPVSDKPGVKAPRGDATEPGIYVFETESGMDQVCDA